MVGTLTVSSKQSPFPFAALAIAAFTQTADVAFDESATGLVLDLNGDKFDEEEGIVHALAKAGGLSDDSDKV
jgi:glutamyl-tRNA synthetase